MSNNHNMQGRTSMSNTNAREQISKLLTELEALDEADARIAAQQRANALRRRAIANEITKCGKRTATSARSGPRTTREARVKALRIVREYLRSVGGTAYIDDISKLVQEHTGLTVSSITSYLYSAARDGSAIRLLGNGVFELVNAGESKPEVNGGVYPAHQDTVA